MSYRDIHVRENSFSRTEANEAKLGAYYTDRAHMASLAPLFHYTGDFFSLDPGCGDMSAMLTLLNKGENPCAKWCCGVELNSGVAAQTRDNPDVYALVEGDFTTSLTATPNSFDFIFTNPAYLDVHGETGDGKAKRLELLYLERISGVNGKAGLLKKDGILVLVVNYHFFSDRGTIRFLMNHYETLHVWRFRPEEYAKWHQVVFIGRRTGNSIHLKEEVDAEMERYSSEDQIPVLPEVLPEELIGTVDVPHSAAGALKTFTNSVFDAEEAARYLDTRPDLPDYEKWLSNRLTQKAYASNSVEDPPIMPGLGNLMLEEVSGVGNGKTGEIGKDLHLARGIVEKVQSVDVVPDPNDSYKTLEKVTTKSQVKMKILEITEGPGGKPLTTISTLE